MFKIKFDGKEIKASSDETVLDCLLKGGVSISHSCKSGICQACLVKVTSGNINPKAQSGLSDDQITQKLICACQQKATQGLELSLSTNGNRESLSRVVDCEYLSSSVVRIGLELLEPFELKAGQFVRIIREDGLCRSYSIAEKQGSKIYIHIRKINNGQMSSWFYDQNLKGIYLKVAGPLGSCYYRNLYQEMDILLAGTGTGLAPLYGILLDALASCHKGKVTLLHGAQTPTGLYYVDRLKEIEASSKKFTYLPCVLSEGGGDYIEGDITKKIDGVLSNMGNSVAFLCGDPHIVKRMKQFLFLKGLPSKMILSDPFVFAVEKTIPVYVQSEAHII